MRAPGIVQGPRNNVRFCLSTQRSWLSYCNNCYFLDDQRTVAYGRGVCLHQRVKTRSGTYQAAYSVVIGGISFVLKCSGRETDESPPSSVENKDRWKCTATEQYGFMTWCLINHRDNFTFTLS